MSHLLWHYIVGPQFQLIVDSGVILPDSFANGGNLDCVWFGRDKFLEDRFGKLSCDRPTDVIYSSNRDEIAGRAGGLGRIGVSSTALPNNWSDYERMLRDCAPVQEIVHRSRMISSRHERFTIQQVPSEAWQTVQIWQDGTWHDMPFER